MQLNDRIDITHELLFHYRNYYSVPNVPYAFKSKSLKVGGQNQKYFEFRYTI